MSKVFFSADHHFGHDNIRIYSKRPYKNLYEMHEDFIYRWNSVVNQEDTVYHLGDISLSKSEREIKTILNRLNGNIVYIKGNHESGLSSIKYRFQSIHDYLEINLDDPEAKGGIRKVILCHYAMRVWNKSHYGSFMCYGHSHGSLTDDPNALSIDVGVDCHQYTPISFDQVKRIMSKKQWKAIDHHGMR